MVREKTIACIGASDEDVAHLRLLLKTAGARLDSPWQWGHEEKADLVIVDTSNMAGSTALIRVTQRGVPCAELIAADAPEPDDGLFLRKPLTREAFVDLLNGGSRPAVAPLAVLSQDDDFFMVDLGEYEDHGDAGIELPAFHEAPQRSLPVEELDAFEAIFKRDELAETPLILTPDRLEAKTGIEYTGERTTRSSTNAHERKPFINDSVSPQNVDPSLRSFSNVKDEGAHPLHTYLTGTLIGSPSRIALPGLPALVLDPKEQVFHSEGPLSALEEYCRRPLRRIDWQPLMSSELRDVRERVPARSYMRLLWLDRMFSSDGYLAPHLDPGGTYRLLQAFEDLAEEYPRAHRIAQAMKTPMRLHEIVAESQTSMAEVFTVVSAYDAIGWVEWQLRESMRSPAKPAR